MDLRNIPQVKLTYTSKVKASDRPKVSSSRDAYEIFLAAFEPGVIEHLEQFWVMLLNRNNRVLGLFHASTGGINGTVMDPRVIMQAAVLANASAVIVCHNHPSGNTSPSDADRVVTSKVKAAGDILDIQLFDHIIITDEDYFSFSDEGIL